jgi:hypothetical protein
MNRYIKAPLLIFSMLFSIHSISGMETMRNWLLAGTNSFRALSSAVINFSQNPIKFGTQRASDHPKAAFTTLAAATTGLGIYGSYLAFNAWKWRERTSYVQLNNNLTNQKTPIKHSGLSIIQRRNTPADAQTLIRYPIADLQKIRSIKLITSLCQNVNETIVHQKETDLSTPAIYISLSDPAALLEKPVSFTLHEGNLFIDAREIKTMDFELHVPKGTPMPRIGYVSYQNPVINTLKY